MEGSDTYIGARSMTQAVDWRAKTQPDGTFCVITVSTEQPREWRKITHKQVAKAVNWTAWWIKRMLGTSSRSETLAYMTNNDLRYCIFCLAAIKTGFKTLLVSPRNSTVANLHLLDEMKCKNFIWSAERHAKVQSVKEARPDIQLWEIPSLTEMLEEEADPFLYNFCFPQNKNDPAIVIHSSGSTGYPKPVVMNHAYFAALDAHTLLPSVEGRRPIMSTVGDGDRAFCMSPFFHLAGFFHFTEAIFRNFEFAIAPDKLMTTSAIADMIIETGATKVVFPPSVLEDITRTEQGIRAIKQLRIIHSGGAPLLPSVGNQVSKLTKFAMTYGSTELGNPAGLEPKADEDWNWIEWHPDMGIEMQPVGENLAEMVMVRINGSKYQSVFHAFPELQEYRTNDLFASHPTKKGLWTFQGRLDDVIVLSNSEKFNPLLMEEVIESHPLVKRPLIIGHNRFQSALIIDPDWTKWTGDEPDSVLIEQIWPYVVKANEVGPGHARLMKSKILITSKTKPLPLTAKGSVHRREVLREYAEEIDALYNQGDEELPSLPLLQPGAKGKEVHDYILQLVSTLIQSNSLSGSSDIFESGVDSLQTIVLSKTLQSALHKEYPEAAYHLIDAQRLYANPTISSIAELVQSIIDSNVNHESTPFYETARLDKINRMIEKFTKDLPKSPIRHLCSSDKYSVVLTGSTGSFGTYILERLLRDPNLIKVYCLNRTEDAPTRQRESFTSRGLHFDETAEAKVVFWQARLGDEHFGLSKDQYQELLSSTTLVIHNAWKVDFNHRLETFESVHIQGVRQLVDFSIESPNLPLIFFVSSQSTIARWNETHGTSVPEVPLPDPALPTRTGYGESKYVAEQILTEASSWSGVPTTILRVGQISGPTTERGEWNRQEWFPILVASSKALGQIPDNLQLMPLDWIPVDRLADITMDLVMSRRKTSDEIRNAVFHLVNPKAASWESLLAMIQKRLKLEKVSFDTWVNNLERIEPTESNVARIPALKLVDFFKFMTASNSRMPLMEVRNTLAASEAMRTLDPIDDLLMERYLNQWGL